MRRPLPADDLARVAVEDEGEVDEAVPGADVGQVADPLLVRARRREGRAAAGRGPARPPSRPGSSSASSSRAACPRARARASRGRPGLGRRRRRAGAAPSRSCARRRHGGVRCGPLRSARAATRRPARGGTASGTCARSACSPARPARGRSARPRRPPAAPPRRRSPSPGRVELRREIDGGVLQDRVRPLQLRVLLAEPLQLFALARRQ